MASGQGYGVKKHMTKRGKMIVLEGPDGVGKTTQANRLMHGWNRSKSTEQPSAYYLFNPSANVIGEAVRKYDGSNATAEALLFVADFIDQTRWLTEWLELGQHVIVDRYVTSTYVYQFPNIPEETRQSLRSIVEEYLIIPDLTVFMRLPAETLFNRTGQRGTTSRYEEGGVARFVTLIEKYAENYADAPGEAVEIIFEENETEDQVYGILSRIVFDQLTVPGTA